MIYCIQCPTGSEDYVKGEINKLPGIAAHLPKKTMYIRRCGDWHKTEYVIIPGYVFVETAAPLTDETYYAVRKTNRVTGWLGADGPESLCESDAEFVRFISNGGEALPILKATSPMIKKCIIAGVDKRQRRITLIFQLFGKVHKITFGYEV